MRYRFHRIPAYQRYAELSKAAYEKKTVVDKLPLPAKFRELEDIFQRVDLAAAIYAGRETCCLEKTSGQFHFRKQKVSFRSSFFISS